MSQKHQRRPKKLSNILLAWIILILSFAGLGTILFLKSKPTSVRYMATSTPFVLPTSGIEEAAEEESEIKEEQELIQLTQPAPANIEQ